MANYVYGHHVSNGVSFCEGQNYSNSTCLNRTCHTPLFPFPLDTSVWIEFLPALSGPEETRRPAKKGLVRVFCIHVVIAGTIIKSLLPIPLETICLYPSICVDARSQSPFLRGRSSAQVDLELKAIQKKEPRLLYRLPAEPTLLYCNLGIETINEQTLKSLLRHSKMCMH